MKNNDNFTDILIYIIIIEIIFQSSVVIISKKVKRILVQKTISDFSLNTSTLVTSLVSFDKCIDF